MLEARGVTRRYPMGYVVIEALRGVEVARGLRAVERIIVHPPDRLEEGERVAAR